MKKFSLLFLAGALFIVSCGPSAEETAKMEAAVKATMDSLTAVSAAGMEAAMPDSTATPDSVAATPEAGH